MCERSKIFFFCVFAFFISCFHKGSANIYFFQPPILDIEKPYTDIESNSTLEINCSGKAPVFWKVPERKAVATNDSRLSIVTSVDTDHVVNKYRSKLVLRNLVYSDTGYYSCYYDGTTDFRFRDNVTSLYVFVNDPDNLFVENSSILKGHMLVILQQNKKGLIACLPTNSRTNVTLWKTESEDDKGEMVSLGTDVIFDPRMGFQLFYPTFYFSGLFQCRASLGKHEQEINLTLFYMPDTFRDPQPFIDIRQALHPVINGTFSLKCSVNVDPGTRVFFDWSYPNKNSSRINETVAFSQMKTVRNYVHQEVTAYLIAKDVQPNDSGTYRCSVTDHSKKTGSTEVKIFVYASEQPTHVNFSTDLNLSGPIIYQADQDVKFVITVQAFPSIADVVLYWEKNGERLPTDNRYHFKTTTMSVILEINKLSRFDAGTYTLFGKTSDMTNNISITLLVKDKPVVTVGNMEPIYMVGKPYALRCFADGYPMPVVWWRWKPCKKVQGCTPGDNYGWSDIEDDIKLPNSDLILLQSINSKNYSEVSVLQVIANHSGHYLCVASNEMGQDEKVIPFIVTDANHGFEISTSNKVPVDLDNVTLTCKANIYNYTFVAWKWQPVDNFEAAVTVENSSDISIINRNSSYSYTSTIKFNPIRCNFSGEYICIAAKFGSNITEIKNITVDVKAIKKPSFVQTNLNGISIISAPASLEELYCYANGTPLPTVIWKKDGLIYDVTNMSGVELVERNQRLIIKRVLEKDTGFYECIAVNKGGNITANVTLDVLGDNEALTQNGLTTSEVIVVFVIIGILVVVLIFFLVTRLQYVQKKKKEFDFFGHNTFERGYVDIFNPNLPLEDQIDLLPYNHQYEFPKERLKLGKTLGQGAFGRVVKAEAIGLVEGEASTTVAVKMLKETANKEQRKALTAELKILIHLGRHLNIVNLLGAVTKNIMKGELMVIVEYCCFGNLRHYLLKHKGSYINQLDPETGKLNLCISSPPGTPYANLTDSFATYSNVLGIGLDNPSYGHQTLHYAVLAHQQSDITNTTPVSPTSNGYFGDTPSSPSDCGNECCSEEEAKNHCITTCDLLCFAFQCARGMEYLSLRKLIHRDLAARNILLAKNNVVKICDFGLAKDCYKYSNYIKKSDGLLPIKWMAIESIRDRVFTSKSDVWSFGVLLWEIFTLGGNPYPGAEINEEFFKKLKNGYRMEKPDLSPDSMYELMTQCWLNEPADRPNFSELAEKIGSLLEASVRKYYVELNTPYQAMNEEMFNNNDYLKMGTNSEVGYANMNSDKQKTEINGVVSLQNTYDNITSVRPVGNGPVPKAPMEVVPMIQLESLTQTLSRSTDELKIKSQSVSNGVDGTSDYISMQNSTQNEYSKSDGDGDDYEDDNDSVFLENENKPKMNLNGSALKIEDVEASTWC